MLSRYIPGQGVVSLGVQDKAAIAVGATGPRGLPGPPGPATTIGATGSEGPIGPPGPRGFQGEKGEKGDIGYTGPSGETGPIGPRGPRGDIGFSGPEGKKGASGPTGPIGPSGPSGERGIQGEKGDVGSTGPQGPPGPATTIGATGATGPVVPTGIYFNSNMTILRNNTITSSLQEIGDFQCTIPSNWTYTSNGFINAILSIHLSQIASTVTINFLYSINDSNYFPLTRMFMSGSDQLVVTGFIPNISIGDVIDIVFQAKTDNGTCQILDYTALSGTIYHVF